MPNIVTLTPNTTLDHTVIIPSFVHLKTIRATGSYFSMGGKPTDAAFILGTIGIPSLALGCAAGAIGRKVEDLLHERGVTTDFIEVNGETRINTVIVCEDVVGQTTLTVNTLDVAPEHIVALKKRYAEELEDASVVVMGGTLPRGVAPEFYAECIEMAHEQHVPTVFDAAEPNLSAGLAAKPTYIKPNEDELGQLTGRTIESFDDAYAAGKIILERFGTMPIITMGPQGALAVLQDRAYFIPAIPVKVVSAGGAGDAVLAGITASLHRGQPIEEGLRLGFAAAAATCLLPGTADVRPEDVERLLPQVELIPYPG
ncbi:MAG: 1-phosphofructokinase family hexose kinase [Anaerolineae bacterium]|nr:1-phosphofructokinase family hexose kinase [Anaerolineae bacterium]